MFTSGSTGKAKGVSFSIYQIVAKRFARAAALPEVGDDEVFLSFLPLYHTFGRFLEMTGAIYWGGTYVFPGNPSVDTLLALLPRVEPTGFISVPVRWAQLHERCLEKIDAAGPGADAGAVMRSVVGRRLRWGLSAAGYLDPRVFRFFEKNGVAIASGFGMTEGTGGITMTPPGRYVDNTHGLPLPGIRVRLGEKGELQISGHYVARYLEDKGPGDIIPLPRGAGEGPLAGHRGPLPAARERLLPDRRPDQGHLQEQPRPDRSPRSRSRTSSSASRASGGPSSSATGGRTTSCSSSPTAATPSSAPA